MIYLKLNILIGGSAGQGIDTVGLILEKILQRSGYHIFSNKDYMSRVRGGNNFVQIRFSQQEVTTHCNEIDAMIALNDEVVNFHINNLKEDGVIIGDKSINCHDYRFTPYPLAEIADSVNNKRAFNIVALGSIMKSFNLDISNVENILIEVFKDKYKSNWEAFTEGYNLTKPFKNIKKGDGKDTILINGNQAIGLGAIAGGVSFYSAYPMTPSTGIINYIAEKSRETKIIYEQAEDEIAAINMALGASYAGLRAMTGSSGGGLSLMTESLGLVGMMETPLVVVNVQRPGPATGLPTRTEQGDLNFMISASHGEIPRMIISLKNPEDAFYQTIRALNLADKYQLLVILLSDQFLADSNRTFKPFDFSEIKINRHLATSDDITDDIYKRYKLTKNGISPRLIPGQMKDQIVITDSDEHDEYGHIAESAEVRTAMVEKRMKKLDFLKQELIEPDYYGVNKIDYLLLGWGSTEGAIIEAVQMLNDQDISAGALVFGDIYPLPTKELIKHTKNTKNIINVEQNFTGQLAKLVRQETGIKCNHNILKYDGRQITAQEIVNQLKEEVV